MPSATQYLKACGFPRTLALKYGQKLRELQQGEVRIELPLYGPKWEEANTLFHGSECKNLPSIINTGFRVAHGSGDIIGAYFSDRKTCAYSYPMHPPGGQIYCDDQQTSQRMIVEVRAYKCGADWRKKSKDNRQWAWTIPNENVQRIAAIFKAVP